MWINADYKYTLCATRENSHLLTFKSPFKSKLVMQVKLTLFLPASSTAYRSGFRNLEYDHFSTASLGKKINEQS